MTKCNWHIRCRFYQIESILIHFQQLYKTFKNVAAKIPMKIAKIAKIFPRLTLKMYFWNMLNTMQNWHFNIYFFVNNPLPYGSKNSDSPRTCVECLVLRQRRPWGSRRFWRRWKYAPSRYPGNTWTLPVARQRLPRKSPHHQPPSDPRKSRSIQTANRVRSGFMVNFRGSSVKNFCRVIAHSHYHLLFNMTVRTLCRILLATRRPVQ